MQEFTGAESTLIIAMIVGYILFTAWLTLKLRSKNTAQFMTAARSMPAIVVGILLMSEFIGAKSTVGTAQEALTLGLQLPGRCSARRSASCSSACCW